MRNPNPGSTCAFTPFSTVDSPFIHLPMALPFDCDRSSLLNYEFPLPVYYQGHTTGSTNSTWSQQWTTLRYWTPPEIASAFRQYWDTTVTADDKDQFVTFRALIDWTITSIRQQQPATVEAQVRHIFDMGISSAHRIAISSDHNQQAPSDPHSTIQLFQNIVFGEPDYLLQNPVTNQVTGICEAKSPWNIGPSEIDDVISG
jgi:hypothetical protein